MIINKRSIAGLSTPVNNNGTPRPLLQPLRPILTVHYTGVSATSYADPGDTAKELYNLQQAVAKVKSFEYNWLIDSEGIIWEYAGDYVAAHSAGENPFAIGVIFWNSVQDDLTDAQVQAFRELRYDLTKRNMLSAGHSIIPHKNMPGAATPCPGSKVLARWSELIVPYTPFIQVPTTAIGDTEMSIDFFWEDANYTNVFAVGSFGVLHVETATVEKFPNVPRIKGYQHHPQTLASMMSKAFPLGVPDNEAMRSVLQSATLAAR